jgi:hypothetical protein
MGCYVNPVEVSKEVWLKNNAKNRAPLLPLFQNDGINKKNLRDADWKST